MSCPICHYPGVHSVAEMLDARAMTTETMRQFDKCLREFAQLEAMVDRRSDAALLLCNLLLKEEVSPAIRVGLDHLMTVFDFRRESPHADEQVKRDIARLILGTMPSRTTSTGAALTLVKGT